MRKPYEIRLWDEAENELEDSYTYYSDRSERVADDFYKHIRDCLERISQDPFSFPIVHQNIRKCSVQKFPFIICFEVNEIVEIIAIFHTSRNPQIWKERG